MNIYTDTLKPEQPEFYDAVESLAEQAFGPGRFARAAFRLREGVMHEPELSFVLLRKEELIGSVRLTKIMVGENEALLLGPLVVKPEFKNCGIGAQLMKKAVSSAREAGFEAIILVGDFDYYKKYGFKQLPHKQIELPGPADPARILICPLVEGIESKFSGQARRYEVKPGSQID